MFQQTLQFVSLIAFAQALKLEKKGKKQAAIQEDSVWDNSSTSVEGRNSTSNTTTDTDYSSLSFQDMAFFETANTNYRSLSYADKMDLLWQRITEDQTPQEMPWNEFAAIFVQREGVSIKHKSDTIGTDNRSSTGRRLKLAHTNGAHAKISWKNMGGHSFSGLFSEDTVGIIRFSETGLPFADIDPDFQTAEMGGSIPSFAIKFPVTNEQSSDFFGMHSFEGFSGFNFFKESFFSSLPVFTKPWLHHTIGSKLAGVTPYIGHMSHAFHRKWTQVGSKVGRRSQKNVYDLRYEAVPETVSHFTDEYTGPLLDKLTAIPSGSHIFNVYARESPTATEEKIAEIYTDSEMVTSLFGDEQLFFRHWTANFDFESNPEWEAFVPKYEELPGQLSLDTLDFTSTSLKQPLIKNGSHEEARALLKDSILNTGCPFQWMFERMYGTGMTPDDLQ